MQWRLAGRNLFYWVTHFVLRISSFIKQKCASSVQLLDYLPRLVSYWTWLYAVGTKNEWLYNWDMFSVFLRSGPPRAVNMHSEQPTWRKIRSTEIVRLCGLHKLAWRLGAKWRTRQIPQLWWKLHAASFYRDIVHNTVTTAQSPLLWNWISSLTSG